MTLKRFIDIVGSAFGLVLAAPFMVVIATVIAVTMGRPVVFAQRRVGRHGTAFTLFKFRTMRVGTGTDTERLTQLGRFLRSTSLDELPELWNILRGDMSLVGPRPLLLGYLPLYDERQARRHEVRPGLTGLAQIEGRNALDWQHRLELDVRYVENRSLMLDLRILARTPFAVLTRSGISAPGAATVETFSGTSDDRKKPEG